MCVNKPDDILDGYELYFISSAICFPSIMFIFFSIKKQSEELLPRIAT